MNCEKILALLEALRECLKLYGDVHILQEYKIVDSAIEYLKEDDVYAKKVIYINEIYRKLYPLQGGLSYFRVTGVDAITQLEMNERLELIHKQLWDNINTLGNVSEDKTFDEFYKLLDKENRNVIIGVEGENSYQYIAGSAQGWHSYSINEYFFPGDVRFERYEVISAELAIQEINKQEAELTDIFEKLKATCPYCFENADNLEQSIVGTLFLSGRDYYEENKYLVQDYPRVITSIDIIFDFCGMTSYKEIYFMKMWRNLCEISQQYNEIQHDSGEFSEEKYQILKAFFGNSLKRLSDVQLKMVTG